MRLNELELEPTPACAGIASIAGNARNLARLCEMFDDLVKSSLDQEQLTIWLDCLRCALRGAMEAQFVARPSDPEGCRLAWKAIRNSNDRAVSFCGESGESFCDISIRHALNRFRILLEASGQGRMDEGPSLLNPDQPQLGCQSLDMAEIARNWHKVIARSETLQALDWQRLLIDIRKEAHRATEHFQQGKIPPAVRDVREQALLIQPGNPSTPATAPATQKKASANARMIDVLTSNPAAKLWTAKEWANRLGYKSASTIKETPTWKHLEKLRAERKVELQLRSAERSSRRPRPK